MKLRKEEKSSRGKRSAVAGTEPNCWDRHTNTS